MWLLFIRYQSGTLYMMISPSPQADQPLLWCDVFGLYNCKSFPSRLSPIQFLSAPVLLSAKNIDLKKKVTSLLRKLLSLAMANRKTYTNCLALVSFHNGTLSTHPVFLKKQTIPAKNYFPYGFPPSWPLPVLLLFLLPPLSKAFPCHVLEPDRTYLDLLALSCYSHFKAYFPCIMSTGWRLCSSFGILHCGRQR